MGILGINVALDESRENDTVWPDFLGIFSFGDRLATLRYAGPSHVRDRLFLDAARKIDPLGCIHLNAIDGTDWNVLGRPKRFNSFDPDAHVCL